VLRAHQEIDVTPRDRSSESCRDEDTVFYEIKPQLCGTFAGFNQNALFSNSTFKSNTNARSRYQQPTSSIEENSRVITTPLQKSTLSSPVQLIGLSLANCPNCYG